MSHGGKKTETLEETDTGELHSIQTFLKHLKTSSFPDRIPTQTKHHRHRRNKYFVKEESTSTESGFDKLSFMKALWARRGRENVLDNSTNDKLVDQVVEKMNKVAQEANTTRKDCKISGRWLSEAAGGLFEMFIPDTGANRNIPVKHKQVNDKVHVGFMKGNDWQASVMFPFSSTNQYIFMTAINKRYMLIALFIGECRLSHRREVLQGSWLILSHSRDCESMGATTKLLGDDWRKDQLDELRACHLPGIQQKSRKAFKCPQNPCNQCPGAHSTATPVKHDDVGNGIFLSPGKNTQKKPTPSTPVPIRLH